MARFIYDISRLSTRVLNAAPNGIDWIDSLLADHFLEQRKADTSTLLFGLRGPRLFAPDDLPNPARVLDEAWGRIPSHGPVDVPDELVSALVRPPGAGAPTARVQLAPTGRTMRVAGALARYGLARGDDPRRAAPQGAVYVNAAHYPLEFDRHVAWFDDRPDVRPVFFVHDLLPLREPKWFWSREPERHARRLALLARRGAGAIVTSREAATDLAAYMRKLGRSDLPILQAHPPVAPLFGAPTRIDPRLEDCAYFLVCGTIEPRKNHAALVDVWRRLFAARGSATPKLLIVGKRGWNCAGIVAAIEDPALGGSVVEANGVSTAAYRALLGGARALLAPSLAEGYGLPLAEALAAGTPAVASDIAPFREIGGDRPLYIDPGNREGWLAAVEALSSRGHSTLPSTAYGASDHQPVDGSAYAEAVDRFLAQFG